MNFLELVKQRHSVRNYTSRKVEDEKVNYLLECARLAPSAVNYQPWRFIVVKSEDMKQKLQECYPREWFATASLYLIACCDGNVSWKRPADGTDHGDIDVAIAVEHICLAAAEQGLGSCWVCNFDVPLCCKYFGIQENTHPVALIPIGYPAGPTPEKASPRKPLEELVSER